MRSYRLPHGMDVFTLGCIGWTLVFQLGERSEAQAQGNQARIEEPHLEDIYIVRSVRESRTTLPTEFCAPTTTNFSAALEDQYTLRSTATAISDGRLIDSNAATVGTLHACFGRTSDPSVVNFYAEVVLDRTTFKGIGDCRLKYDFPEPGISSARCFLDLSGLPAAYAGGMLTSNSINSRKDLGMESDPPGYTQASVATVRLWRTRSGR